MPHVVLKLSIAVKTDFSTRRLNQVDIHLPKITTTAQSSVDSDPAVGTSQAQSTTTSKRPPLHRQDYSTCIDSSEPQSDDSHLTRDSITRESQNDELSSSTHDKIDVSTLPLPALPPKKRRTRLRASPSRHHSGGGAERSSSSRRGHDHEQHSFLPNDELRSSAQSKLHVNNCISGGGGSGSGGSGGEATPHLSAFQQYVAKRRESLEASTRSFNEKLEARRMHYHMGGGGGGGSGITGTGMPTYIFGEHCYGGGSGGSGGSGGRSKTPHANNKEEIFLNKSGWVQVNTKRSCNDENRASAPPNVGYRRGNYVHHNGGAASGSGDARNTIRVIQIDNTRRSDLARQALLQHQHSVALDAGTTPYGKYAAAAAAASKVEELIQRNEARLGAGQMIAMRDSALRPGYRIVDPQLANILNERPGFLPVKNRHDADSPPPITPILSPPPAFQDSSKSKYFDRRKTIPSRQHQATLHTNNMHANSNGSGQGMLNAGNSIVVGGGGSGPKGMVFSRSFEYDMRRPAPPDTYVETFSRSFDGNLSERDPMHRERSPNFSSLTGNSPNYLSKKDSGGGSSGSLRSRDNSPKYQPQQLQLQQQQPQTTAYLNASIKEAPPAYSHASGAAAVAAASRYSPRARHDRAFERSKSHNVLVRSRKSQFNRVASGGAIVGVPMGNQQPTPCNVGMSRFRSFDTAASQRLNSCDSGARSDLSNDELDCDDDAGSSEFLTANYHHSISPLKTQRQRSLTPDRNESHSSSSSVRKQRSLTPESRSLTPEDRRRKGGSQASLMGSRQNSSSRSNTLERKQRLEGQSVAGTNISRSSSSSSYSGGGLAEHDLSAHKATIGAPGVVSGGVILDRNSSGVRTQHRRSLGRNAKQVDEHRIRRSRSLQLSERSPNRTHKVIVSMGQSHGSQPSAPAHIYQQAAVRSNGVISNFPPTIRTSSKSQAILLNNNTGSGAGVVGRARNSDIDKSRSFDFDYCNYNNAIANTAKTHSGVVNCNQNVPLRLDFDKSRSFDEDYREPINTNSNNLSANGMRYLQTLPDGGGNVGSTSRLRRSSPVGSGSGERTSRSPQSSGSSCNNLHLPRQSTSPQSYGTRLCDHELTYDMLRKSLDRSPIMDFRRGESAEYELPQTVMRNRETINSGGNSELNFFNNDTAPHVYEKPKSATGSLKQQRSLGHTQSPSESQYSLDRLHGGSRDSNTPDGINVEYRSSSDYMYRQPSREAAARESGGRGSSRSSHKLTAVPKTTTTAAKRTPTTRTTLPSTIGNYNNATAKKTLTQRTTATNSPQISRKSADLCKFWPHCGACNVNAVSLKRQSSQHEPNAVAATAASQEYTKSVETTCQQPQRNTGTNATSRHSQMVETRLSQLEGGDTAASNMSNVSVKVTQPYIKPTNSISRSKSQWTLLCSGAALENPTKMPPTQKRSSTLDLSDARLMMQQQVASPTVKPRVIPLAATSLVFLGDCEMPITRERVTDQYERNRVSEVRDVKSAREKQQIVRAAADDVAHQRKVACK